MSNIISSNTTTNTISSNAISSISFKGKTYTFTLPYGECKSAADAAEKTVDVNNFSLETGAIVLIKFTENNTAEAPTLNVEGTGAKEIYYNGAIVPTDYLLANRIYEFIYDGTCFSLVGSHTNLEDTISDIQSQLDTLNETNRIKKTFNNIKIDDNVISAETADDTLTIVAGDNITITPDILNDTITISATGGEGTSYVHPTDAGYKHIPAGGSSGQILRWKASGEATWGDNIDTTNIAYIDETDNENIDDISTLLTSADIYDGLDSTSTNAVLSANQGRILDDTKVDKEDGKGLSTNDLTDELKNEYDTIVAVVGDTELPTTGDGTVTGIIAEIDNMLTFKPCTVTMAPNVANYDSTVQAWYRTVHGCFEIYIVGVIVPSEDIKAETVLITLKGLPRNMSGNRRAFIWNQTAKAPLAIYLNTAGEIKASQDVKAKNWLSLANNFIDITK